MPKYNIREFTDNKEYNLRNADPEHRTMFLEELEAMDQIQAWLKAAGERQQFSIRRTQAYAGGNYCLLLRNDSGYSFQSFSIKVTLYAGNRPVYETWAKTGSWNEGTEGQLIFSAPDAPYTSFTLDTKDVTYERISLRPYAGTKQGGRSTQQGTWQQGTGGQGSGGQTTGGQTARQQSTGQRTTPSQPTPWIFIILAFVFFWPLGIFLLVRRINEMFVMGTNTGKPQELYDEQKPTPKKPNDILLLGGAILCLIIAFGEFMILVPEIPYQTVSQLSDEIVMTVAFAVLGTVLLVYQQKTKAKFRRYDLIIDESQPTVSLDYVADSYPADYNQVTKDLQKMLDRGYFPGAFLDFAGRTIVFPENGGKRATTPADSPADIKRKQDQKAAYEAKLKNNPDSKEARVKTIRDCKALIEDKEFDAKLEKLAVTTEKIHDRVAEKPNQKGEIDRFMNKYLPLIIKAIDTYADLVKKGIPGQEVADLKKQLESSLDNFIQAFENVLAKLYVDDVVDVSTDITAIEGALAGEGLLDDNSEILRGKFVDGPAVKVKAAEKTVELATQDAPEKAEAGEPKTAASEQPVAAEEQADKKTD